MTTPAPSAPVAVLSARAELAMLRARYDSGAVSPAIYAVIRRLEIEVAWQERGADRQ